MFSYFDLIVLVLVALLSLKGAIVGFTKELFSFTGIVGGLFVASRFAEDMAALIGTHLLSLQDQSLQLLIGFLSLLILIWLSAYLISEILYHLKGATPPSPPSRVGGWILSFAKHFIVISIIVVSFWQVDFLRNRFDDLISNSLLFKPMQKIAYRLIPHIRPKNDTSLITKEAS